VRLNDGGKLGFQRGVIGQRHFNLLYRRLHGLVALCDFGQRRVTLCGDRPDSRLQAGDLFDCGHAVSPYLARRW
jgi:hypothetical protein